MFMLMLCITNIVLIISSLVGIDLSLFFQKLKIEISYLIGLEKTLKEIQMI